MNDHPHGHEIRVYLRGEFHYSRLHATRELAEADADERKRELLDDGWTDRPAMPQ